MKDNLFPSTESDFRTVILNEDDTEFVKSAVGIVGYRYGSKDFVFRGVSEGDKLEITDHQTSTFVIQCLLKRASLSSSLVAAHRKAFERIQEYGLPKLSEDAYERVIASIEEHEAISATAELLVDDILTTSNSAQDE